jgi:glycosyltransferase involved in cell wall biosynthesis
MRITHVITRLVVGGAQENTIASVLGLRKKVGFDLKLISGPTTGPEGTLEPIARAIPKLLTIVPELIRPVHPVQDWIAFQRLTKIFLETKPDIVHTHSGKAGILGRLAAAKAHVPVIIHHIHGPSFGPFQGTLANFIFTAAERHAAKVTHHFFCSAEAMTKLYLAAGIGKPEMYTRVISGFDVKTFANPPDRTEARHRLGITEDEFVVGTIARIAPLKGHSDLLQAVAEAISSFPKIRVLFVGDGSLRSKVEAQVRALGLEQHVIFTGMVPPSEVPRYVSAMDCVAHLSSREALARALPQALTAGKPIIAYDFDGAEEVCIDGETGFLIKGGEIATVVDRLLKLARNPALRYDLGQRGRQLVAERFSVERMVEQQAEVYLQLAKARGIPTP